MVSRDTYTIKYSINNDLREALSKIHGMCKVKISGYHITNELDDNSNITSIHFDNCTFDNRGLGGILSRMPNIVSCKVINSVLHDVNFAYPCKLLTKLSIKYSILDHIPSFDKLSHLCTLVYEHNKHVRSSIAGFYNSKVCPIKNLKSDVVILPSDERYV